MSSAAPRRDEQARWGPFLWGPRLDLAAFAGSAALALTLVALTRHLAGEDGAMTPVAFLVLVVAVDVAHVYSTLFRTYFDKEELARRPRLYALVPLGCFAVGALVHAVSEAWFWRVLAYVAVFHFVRQQVGWVAIYRARAADRSPVGRWVDAVAVYASTGYPLLAWHASPDRAFSWFVPGDFFSAPALAPALPFARAVWVAALVVYAVRAARRTAETGTFELGKHVVVATTAITWYVGIVATNSDFAFTAANVLVHGIPYILFLFFYAKRRAAAAPATLVGRTLKLGFVGFIVVLQGIAFFEEMIWDRLVWHTHPDLFGEGHVLGRTALAILVPLLAVPQATHYVLDAVLWRRRDTGPVQAAAMGF